MTDLETFRIALGIISVLTLFGIGITMLRQMIKGHRPSWFAVWFTWALAADSFLARILSWSS